MGTKWRTDCVVRNTSSLRPGHVTWRRTARATGIGDCMWQGRRCDSSEGGWVGGLIWPTCRPNLTRRTGEAPPPPLG
ncbi:hypothetical protein BHM03_00027923 [Ensete ventricosum]|nr:hypothetical protein BHM03_00027923 [Ensete ventricosum]